MKNKQLRKKKLLLLKSRFNKCIWYENDEELAISEIDEHSLNAPENKDQFLKNLGVPYQTLQSAINRNKNGLSDSSIEKVCNAINQNFLSRITRPIGLDDFYDDISLDEFADVFYLKPNIVKRILDDYFFSVAPLLPLFYIQNKESAEEAFDKIKGFYYLYRFGLTQSSFQKIHKIGLHIRRVLYTQHGYVIRCKMLVVDDSEKQPFKNEYDGYVYKTNGVFNFIFTPRKRVEWCTLTVVANQTPENDPGVVYKGIYQSTMDSEDRKTTQLQTRQTAIYYVNKGETNSAELFDKCCTYEGRASDKTELGNYKKYEDVLMAFYKEESHSDVFTQSYQIGEFSRGIKNFFRRVTRE